METGAAAEVAAGTADANSEGADEATAAPPPNIDVVEDVLTAVAVCPNKADPPPNILPEAAVDVAGEAAVEDDTEREPNNESAAETVVPAAAGVKENGVEDAAVVVVATVNVEETAVIAADDSEDDVTSAESVMDVLPKTSAAVEVEVGLEVAAEANENPVLGAVVALELDKFAVSPAAVAAANENVPLETAGVEVANPEKIFPVLLKFSASLGIGLQILMEPKSESVGSSVVAGGIALAAPVDFGSVTFGAPDGLVPLAVVLDVLELKFKLETCFRHIGLD